MATPGLSARLSFAVVATVLLGFFVGGKSLATETASDGCDPSYPTICIPVASPDVDCADLRAQGLHDLEVRPPDPHRLDRDRDGIGCESKEPVATDPTADPTPKANKTQAPVPKEIPAGL